MKKGGILVLVFGLILILSYITKSFLKNVQNNLVQIEQLCGKYDYSVHEDSILSIIIADLYLYLNDKSSFKEFLDLVDKNVTLMLEERYAVNVVPIDGKIFISLENLGVLRKFLEVIKFSYEDSMTLVAVISDFLEENSDKVDWDISELLSIPEFRRYFFNSEGYLNSKWRIFSENVTTYDTGGLNINNVSEEVLQALCEFENWNVEQVRACLSSKHNNISDTSILNKLYSYGFSFHQFPQLTEKTAAVEVVCYRTGNCNNFKQHFIIIFEPNGYFNYKQFPFKVLKKTNKF